MATPEFLDTPNRRVPGQIAQVPGNLVPAGYQQLTSVSSATGLGLATNAYRALIQAESESIRWRDDGTDPTASIGMLIAAGETLFYTGDLSAIKFIAVTGSPKVNVSYYR